MNLLIPKPSSLIMLLLSQKSEVLRLTWTPPTHTHTNLSFLLFQLATSSEHLSLMLLSHFIPYGLSFLFFWFPTSFLTLFSSEIGTTIASCFSARKFKSLKHYLDGKFIRADSGNEWEERRALKVRFLLFCKLLCDYAKLFSYVFCQTKYVDTFLAFWRGNAVHVHKCCISSLN